MYDPQLPETYIHNLNEQDTETLIEETKQHIDQLEHQLDNLMWENDSRYPDGPPPSSYSYDPRLYEEETTNDPVLLQKLRQAQELKTRIATAYAIYATTQTHYNQIQWNK